MSATWWMLDKTDFSFVKSLRLLTKHKWQFIYTSLISLKDKTSEIIMTCKSLKFLTTSTLLNPKARKRGQSGNKHKVPGPNLESKQNNNIKKERGGGGGQNAGESIDVGKGLMEKEMGYLGFVKRKWKRNLRLGKGRLWLVEWVRRSHGIAVLRLIFKGESFFWHTTAPYPEINILN